MESGILPSLCGRGTESLRHAAIARAAEMHGRATAKRARSLLAGKPSRQSQKVSYSTGTFSKLGKAKPLSCQPRRQCDVGTLQ